MTTPIPLHIRRLDPQREVDAFLDMFMSVYGHPMSHAQWHWKYATGPNTSVHNWVAEHADTGQLLGHIGAVLLPGYNPEAPGQALHWTQIGDVMVVAQARGDLGQGSVYRQLVTHMQRQLIGQYLQKEATQLYAYGFPGERPFRLGERMGFYRRLYNCDNYLYNDLLKKKSQASAWWRRWWSPPLTLSVAPAWDAPTLDRLWHSLSATLTGPSVIKNSAYLLWRYHHHPQIVYTLWWCMYASRLVGWLITAPGGDGRVVVIDSLVDPQHWSEAAHALAAQHSGQDCVGWRPVEGASIQPTPIVAIEICTSQFHETWPVPQFQPGDTDVF